MRRAKIVRKALVSTYSRVLPRRPVEKHHFLTPDTPVEDFLEIAEHSGLQSTDKEQGWEEGPIEVLRKEQRFLSPLWHSGVSLPTECCNTTTCSNTIEEYFNNFENIVLTPILGGQSCEPTASTPLGDISSKPRSHASHRDLLTLNTLCPQEDKLCVLEMLSQQAKTGHIVHFDPKHTNQDIPTDILITQCSK